MSFSNCLTAKLGRAQKQEASVSTLAIMAAANEAGIPPGGVILALNNIAPNEPQSRP